ncbi:MAG: FtsX-like permease family protein, partial [Clostridia bacterium]|nr:FtsX-like permease family protein [Clostridia bacterium]
LLQSAKALLSGNVELPDASIQRALDEAESLISTLENNLDRLETARADLRAVMEEIAAAEIEGIDTAELRARLQQAVDQLAALGLSTDTVDGAVQQARDTLAEASARKDELAAQLSTEDGRAQLQEQLRAMLGSYVPSGTITEIVLDAALGQVNSLYGQAQNGMSRINNGLRQIREGLQLADEKELEIDSGLMQVQAGNEQLNGALRQIADGFSQLGEADEQIAEGRAEIERYQAQIDEGRQALNEGYAQLADYQAQLDEGFEQLQIGQEEIASALEEIEDGKRQIDEAVAEARQQLADGEAQLADKRAEAEDGWVQALADFAEMKSELQRAYEELAGEEGYEALCNQFLLRFSPEASPDAVLEDVKKALSDAGVEVKSTVLYESSPINRRINNNLIPIETMANFIPMIFFAIAMIVVYLFMSLMIRQCRREIGILRALGFTRFRVVSLFCGAGLLVSLGAVAFGLAVSLAVRGYFVHYFFDILFPLPVHVLVFSWPKFLLSAALTLAAVETSTVVSALSISGIQPSEAMTRVKPSAVKIPRFVRWALRGASPFLKFSVISLLRNRLRFLFSTVCIAGSVMLIFTSRSLISSTNEILDRTFTRSIHYDCQIFIGEKEADDLRRAVAALPYVSDVERMDYYTASFFLNGHSESAKVAVVRENTRLLSVEDQKRNVLPITGDGVVLEKHLAERLGASIGDTVEVNGAPLRVSAVSEQCAARFQYIADTQASVLGDCTLRSLICHVPVEYESEFMGFLVEQDGYLYAVFTHSAYSSCLFLLQGANLACWMLIVIAMIIGLVIVVNTSQTNLLEQKRELCVLRSLGFQHGELSLYWFAQSLLHFLCSCVLGFPAGIAMAKRAIQNMEMELYTYTFVNNPWDYAVTAGLVFVYMVFSHFLSMRSLRRWDVVECVKDKE